MYILLLFLVLGVPIEYLNAKDDLTKKILDQWEESSLCKKEAIIFLTTNGRNVLKQDDGFAHLKTRQKHNFRGNSTTFISTYTSEVITFKQRQTRPPIFMN